MEYFIKIKSKAENLIIIENHIKKIISKNSFINFVLNIENGENFIINVEPLENISQNANIPYKIYVENINNRLIIKSSNIEVLNYKNAYFVTLNNLIASQNMNVLASTNSFSVFNTIVTNISTKNGTINLPDIFSLEKTEKINSSTILLFKNYETCPTKYVVVLKNDEVIFKDYYTKINLENKIEILSCVFDIAKHAILTTIENKNITQKTVYANNKPSLTTCPQIIPLAFLQALKVKNIKLCKYYLSNNLKEKASLETLQSYFKDYKKIEFFLNKYILFYENLPPKELNVEITNNKISKIDLKS